MPGKPDVFSEVIPVSMGRKLATLFPQNARFTEVPECRHNEVVFLAGPEIGRALRELAGFDGPR
ncbi:MAG TPA: hypothetical protein VGH65_04865 [Verrucomicrobiaceae bacterium]